MKKVFESIKDGLFFEKISIKFRNRIYKTNSRMSDKKFLIQKGKVRLGYRMNLDNPSTFNEKINWYKLNYRNDLMPICVDKYAVYDYVKSKGLENILIPMYGIYDSIEQIDLEKLPGCFVAKLTGDSGGVLICRDKSKFYNEANKKLDVNCDYSDSNKEWPYHMIKNRIIVEELIKTKDGKSPNDYKFFCFNGEPKFLYVASDRDTHCKFDFYDLNWNHIPVKQGHPNNKKGIKKPEQLEEMLNICRKLSKDFPHVRVDLYYENGKIYFGELTFFHMSGFAHIHPHEWETELGNWITLPKSID